MISPPVAMLPTTSQVVPLGTGPGNDVAGQGILMGDNH